MSKSKKNIRLFKPSLGNEEINSIKKELGDVLWYISYLCTEFDFKLEDVAQQNLQKLELRTLKGTISGSGDDR